MRALFFLAMGLSACTTPSEVEDTEIPHLQGEDTGDDADTEATDDLCADVESWSGSFQHYPACLEASPDRESDANYCEFWVDGFAKGSWSHSGTWASWIQADLILGEPDGEVLESGMLVHYRAGGEDRWRWSLSTASEPGRLTGFTYIENGDYTYDIVDFAFFLDVLRDDGTVDRLWLSDHGTNYTLDEVYALPGTYESIGAGSLEWADQGVSLFDQKRSCG